VFENTTTGDRYVWFMNGTTYTGSAYLGGISLQWHIAGVADFNADGQPDLVFENTSTGDRYFWLMNGTAFSSAVYLGNVTVNWKAKN
jgi:predicted small integral membrane protein